MFIHALAIFDAFTFFLHDDFESQIMFIAIVHNLSPRYMFLRCNFMTSNSMMHAQCQHGTMFAMMPKKIRIVTPWIRFPVACEDRPRTCQRNSRRTIHVARTELAPMVPTRLRLPIVWFVRTHVTEPYAHYLFKINSFVDTHRRVVNSGPLASFVISKFDTRIQKLQVALGRLLIVPRADPLYRATSSRRPIWPL